MTFTLWHIIGVSVIVAIVVAIVLIIVGGILLAMGLSFAGDGKPEITLTQQEVLIQESFENIRIDTKDCDVTFVPYNGTADAHVVILERENTHHDVWVEDNTLKIECGIMVSFGYSVVDVAKEIQSAVTNAVESTTGAKVTSVNVNVCGIVRA